MVVFFIVLSPGIEPGSQVPQTCILSVELREHILFHSNTSGFDYII